MCVSLRGPLFNSNNKNNIFFLSVSNKLLSLTACSPDWKQLLLHYNEYALWRHQMETFFALLAICVGNSPVTVELMFSLICAWINGLVNKGEAGDLRRHRAHYDVAVMITYISRLSLYICPVCHIVCICFTTHTKHRYSQTLLIAESN